MSSSWLLVFLGVVLAAGTAWAQNPPEGPAQSRPRFFERPVDLWGKGRSYAAGPEHPGAEPGRSRRPSDWGQVVRQADGSYAYRELPASLVRVLEDPSQANVEAYLAWKLGRARKILAAAEKIRSYRPAQPAPDGLAAPAIPVEGSTLRELAEIPRGGVPSAKLELVYFHKKGCPPCGKQNEILAAWLRGRPGLRFRVVEFGEEPDLWREHRVRGTPSLLFREPSSGRSVLLSGLSETAAMDRAAAQALAAKTMENAP